MRAFSRSLEIIGEAAKRVPEEFKKEHLDADWKAMAGMRDRLIHGYFDVDYEIVWDVIDNELPILKEQLKNLIRYYFAGPNGKYSNPLWGEMNF